MPAASPNASFRTWSNLEPAGRVACSAIDLCVPSSYAWAADQVNNRNTVASALSVCRITPSLSGQPEKGAFRILRLTNPSCPVRGNERPRDACEEVQPLFAGLESGELHHDALTFELLPDLLTSRLTLPVQELLPLLGVSKFPLTVARLEDHHLS